MEMAWIVQGSGSSVDDGDVDHMVVIVRMAVLPHTEILVRVVGTVMVVVIITTVTAPKGGGGGGINWNNMGDIGCNAV